MDEKCWLGRRDRASVFSRGLPSHFQATWVLAVGGRRHCLCPTVLSNARDKEKGNTESCLQESAPGQLMNVQTAEVRKQRK